MAKEQIQVILIETFRGEKYVLRLDREYEKALTRLLKNLFRDAALGSLAHISLRNIQKSEYSEIPLTAAFMEQEGAEDGKVKNEAKPEEEIH